MSHDAENGSACRKTLILYGTETGNAQDVAYELSLCLRRLHFRVVIRELDAVSLQELSEYDLVSFALSTTGQGEFPSNARKFWHSLLRKKLSSILLAGLQYGIIGLCDSSYPKFNLAARKLHKRLQQLGATPLLQPCEADEQGDEGTEGNILAWLPLFQEEVLGAFPLQNGQTPISTSQRLPSVWTLGPRTNDKSTNGVSNGIHRETPQSTSPAILPGQGFDVTLTRNERVTPSTHWQDVRILELRSETKIPYLPGDALAIRPKNLDTDVNQLLQILDWNEIADQDVTFVKHDASLQVNDIFDSAFAGQTIFTLRQLLTNYLDINAIPRRSFFAKIAHMTNDEMQKERALEFADPQYLDEYFDYATRPRRSILEVLQEFNTVEIPWKEAINVFPLMRPRQFSIASGGLLKENGSRFELLVAIVKYRTVIKRIREGVCTKYLAALPLGTTLNVTLHTEGRFHAQDSGLKRQHLLIGGGTGIAPLRSVVHEKLCLLHEPDPSTLIFGCRNIKSDFFFQDEWSSLEGRQNASFKIISAFSRDQENKVYVQDRIREHADRILEILQDARSTIIVCGSSGAMPKAVRQAIKEVITLQTKSEILAEERLIQLEKENRYKQETW